MPEFAEGGAAYIGRGRHLEYNESCLNVRNIHLGLWWHNTVEKTLTFTPPSKAWHPDMHRLVAQSTGTVSEVSVKLMMGWKGSLEKLMAEMCWGALGFWWWNSDMSLLTPLTSSDGLHSSSFMLYPFQCTRYSSFPQRIWLLRMSSTSYYSTPLRMTGGGRSH